MIGLVMEGGGMRGLYTAGVLDAFLDNNISFDGIVGVSAGACFGPNFLSGQRGRALRYNKRFNPSRKYMGVMNWLRDGDFFNSRLAYDEVPRRLEPFDDESYKKSKVPLYAVCTNTTTGEAEYMQVKSVFEDMDIIHASSAIPFLSTPVKIGDYSYLDGAIADSIPWEKTLEMGFDKIVVILTKDAGFVRKKISSLLCKLFYGKKYPKVGEALINRHISYNDSKDRLFKMAETGKVKIIMPSKRVKIGRIERDPNRMQDMYELGLRDANADMKSIKEFLSE